MMPLDLGIHSIHALCSELLNDGFAFVCTSRFNQDCLENFVSALRGKQGWNENPSPAQFHTAFRSAVVLASLDSSSNNKNCVDDDDFALLSEETVVLTSEAATENTSLSRPSDVVDACLINDDDMWSDVTNEILHSDICYEQGVIETFTEAEESLIAYLSGWLARKCGICSRCQDVLSKQLGDHSYCCRPCDMFANNKRYTGSASVGLVEPCDELVTVVRNMEQLFRLNYETYLVRPNVAFSLFRSIHPQ